MDKEIETQYVELFKDIRNLETRLYVILPAYLLILGTSLKFLVGFPDNGLKLSLIGFILLVAHAFTSLFAKLSIHQRALRQALGILEKNNKLVEVPRTSSGLAGVKQLEIITYKRWSPLWIYFRISADGAIMWLMMTSILGILVYFVKTSLDLTLRDFRVSNDILSVVIGAIFFVIYSLILARKDLKKKAITEQRKSKNEA